MKSMRRIKLFAAFMLTLHVLLMGRLLQLQLVQVESYSKKKINLLEKSVKQRTQQFVIDSGRGQFLDANNQPLSYSERYVLVLFPFIQFDDQALAKLSSNIPMDLTTLQKTLKETKQPVKLTQLSLNEHQVKEINNLRLDGVFVVKEKIVKDTPLATQFIGITGENQQLFDQRYPSKSLNPLQPIGQTGLQKMFDELLLSEGNEKLMYHVDAFGRPLFGLDVKYSSPNNSFFPLNIKTTIDGDLQQELENYIDTTSLISGGILLLDIENSELKAVVSRPKITNNDPFSNPGIENLMFTQLTPGSVFKTVIAAAAIENLLVNDQETFDCDKNIYGEIEVEKMQFGQLNFKESFTKSCNAAFGELAVRLTRQNPKLIARYAEKLGVVGGVGWKGDFFHNHNYSQLEEDIGQIYTTTGTDNESVHKQTGIGQLDVQVTPLAIANMMATIARGGERFMVNGVSEVQYQNGSQFYSFDTKHLEGETISPYTAMKLQELLRSVVKSKQGTAHALSELPYEVAGKTGTAEVEIRNGTPYYHKWFAGYFPFDKPKYALVVVNTNTTYSGESAHQLFADTVNILKSRENLLYNQ
ncbi:penicillin-binding transpeptidase domain-containing protein [Bacillus spongiae]|uniref:serine-type D-Ala-D-Ala carboxypeptidase n=1 Tax=Bacillus spongiae TaxID=2683610 RepID=A0ABU8H8Y4_9BACI